jgi:hypothetical protein
VCRSARPERPLAVSGESAAAVLISGTPPAPASATLRPAAQAIGLPQVSPINSERCSPLRSSRTPRGRARLRCPEQSLSYADFLVPVLSYYLSSHARGEAPLSVLKPYIERQKKPD